MLLKRFAGAAALAFATMFGGTSSQAAVIDLGFVFDRSTSINSTDFGLARSALASAVALIPTSNPDVQYRIGVVSFGAGARTEVTPTVLTAGNQATVLAGINAMTQAQGGATAMASGIDLIVSDFAAVWGPGNADKGEKSLINMTTDGQPNQPRHVSHPDYTGNSFTDTTNAVADSATAGWDSFSIEAVGSGATSPSPLAFLGGLPYPTPVSVLEPGDSIPNPLDNSFVLKVTDYSAYGDAIAAKVQRIVDDTGGGDPNVVPLPAGLPLLLGGIGMMAMLRRRAAAA